MTMWARRNDWVGSQVEDSFVMVHLESGAYVALNQTACTAWTLLADPCDEEAITDHLIEKFAVDRDTCRQSVDKLLQQMLDQSLIEKQA